jgi:hypothetical protein
VPPDPRSSPLRGSQARSAARPGRTSRSCTSSPGRPSPLAPQERKLVQPVEDPHRGHDQHVVPEVDRWSRITTKPKDQVAWARSRTGHRHIARHPRRQPLVMGEAQDPAAAVDREVRDRVAGLTRDRHQPRAHHGRQPQRSEQRRPRCPAERPQQQRRGDHEPQVRPQIPQRPRRLHRPRALQQPRVGADAPREGRGADRDDVVDTSSTRPRTPPWSGSFDGSQPPANSSVSTTALNAHNGGGSRRIRPLITPHAGRPGERAISEPAGANITPREGNRTVSQAQPNRW